jgi:hypothetical protein
MTTGMVAQAGLLRGAPTALAGDDLVTIGADATHHHRLHHTVGADRGRQFRQSIRVHPGARLVATGLQQFDRECVLLLGRRTFSLCRVAEQRIEAAAESTFLGRHGVFLSLRCSALRRMFAFVAQDFASEPKIGHSSA